MSHLINTLYGLAKPLVFRLPAETAHHLTLSGLKLAYRLKLLRAQHSLQGDKTLSLLGLRFANPVGLAAGLDKNADYLDALGALGFGFVEVGTVTPLPQSGNPKPRLFRLPEREAILNRMGFNNKGVDHLVNNLQRRRYQGIVGVNIGKGRSTPLEKASEDYVHCLKKVYPYADYIAVNLSSPNTQDLRQLQFGESLEGLLEVLCNEKAVLQKITQRRVPLLVKISPDLDLQAVKSIAQAVQRYPIDGLIATNTTTGRDGVADTVFAAQAGGLSGAPLKHKAQKVLRILRKHLPENYPVIGVGGITSVEHAQERLDDGAQLIQIYSGLIFKGPQLISNALKKLVW